LRDAPSGCPGLNVPDLAIVGLMEISMGTWESEAITTLRATGVADFDAIVDFIERKRPTGARTVMPCHLRWGSSNLTPCSGVVR